MWASRLRSLQERPLATAGTLPQPHHGVTPSTHRDPLERPRHPCRQTQCRSPRYAWIYFQVPASRPHNRRGIRGTRVCVKAGTEIAYVTAAANGTITETAIKNAKGKPLGISYHVGIPCEGSSCYPGNPY